MCADSTPNIPHRVLVTGATGLIGSRLAELLVASGTQVVGAGRLVSRSERDRADRLASLGVQLRAGSVTNAAACAAMVADCSHVIHLAAAQHEMNIPRRTFFRVNVEGTRRLLEASQAAGIQRFVYGSTIGVYGDGGERELDETSPLRPVNDYGESKLAAEQLVLEWRDRLPVTIARISETYGPGDERLLKLFRAIARGRFLLLGPGTNLKQLVYVDDLAQGLADMARRDTASGEIFLLAGAQTMTTREVVAHVAAAVGRADVATRSLPMWPFEIAAAVMETTLRPLRIQPPLHRRRLDFFRKSFAVSIRKAREGLGFDPRTDFATGARLTADWYRRQGLL